MELPKKKQAVDLFLFIGQSNMAGRAAPAGKETALDTAPVCLPGAGYEFKAVSAPDGLSPVCEPFGVDENDPDGIWEPGAKTGSLVTAFINAYYAYTETPVVGVSASRGGSSIEEWLPGTPFFQDAARRFRKADSWLMSHRIPVRHRYMLWCQGETDGKIGRSAQDYTSYFAQVVQGLEQCGIEHCFMIRIGHFNAEAASGAPTQDYRVIQKAQDLIAATFPNVTMVSTDFSSMRDMGMMPDAYHYCQHAYNEIGTQAGICAGRFVCGKKEVCTDNAYGTPFPMEKIEEPVFEDRVFTALSYPDIDAAVRACAMAGGGTVEVSAGRWLSGPIRLYSGVRLHVALGAVIVFRDDPEDYLPPVFTRWEGTECLNYCPLIYAADAENVAVCGEGVLCGAGQRWWEWKTNGQDQGANALYDMAAAGVPVENRVFGTRETALRPSFVQFVRCKGVLVEGVTLVDGPQWTLHPVYCRDVIVRGIRIHTVGPNTDGLNPDSCRNVLIEDSTFFTGDDCVAVNAGLNEDGWRVGIPCENIVIRRCIMTGGHGGIVVGSAISGGVRNVYAYDCDISGTMQGLRMKSMRGRGGVVEEIWFRDIRIQNVSDQALQVNQFYEYSTVMPKTKEPSRFGKIYFENIRCYGAGTALELKGLPEQPLVNVEMKNLWLKAKEGIRCSDVNDIRLQKVNIEC